MTLRELPPQAITATVGSSLENFVLGPTQVITDRWFTHLGGWLPDNQRLLVTWHVTPVPDDPNEAQEEIGTYNIHTGELVKYGQRKWVYSWDPPMWLPAIEQVAYYSDEGIWISGPDPHMATHPVLPDQKYYLFPMTTTHDQVLVILQDTHQLATVNANGNLTPLPINLDELGLTFGYKFSNCGLLMQASPDFSTLAIVGCVEDRHVIVVLDLTDYSTQAFALEPYKVGLPIMISLKWSPDSQQLALVQQITHNSFTGLWVLDVPHAELTWMDIPTWNLVWSPQARYLGVSERQPPGYALVDLQTGTRLPILTKHNLCTEPSDSFTAGGMAWSTDGQHLVLLDGINLWLCLSAVTPLEGHNEN